MTVMLCKILLFYNHVFVNILDIFATIQNVPPSLQRFIGLEIEQTMSSIVVYYTYLFRRACP